VVNINVSDFKQDLSNIKIILELKKLTKYLRDL